MEKKRIVIILIFVIIFLLLIIASFLYNKDKYSVSFETGTSEVFLTKYVSKDEKVSAPTNPIKEGYVFKEWQLNGEKYDFDTKINSNTVLTAKWIKEEYVTITFETNSIEKLDKIKILKGDIIDNLPVSYKEDYEFIGWYLNDELYNNVQIFDDTTLVAKYKNDSINMTYKIGDFVSIVGTYSNSSSISNKSYTNNKRAIGWKRVILDIIDNSEFPYVVGDETGVTGYFKASSIEKI